MTQQVFADFIGTTPATLSGIFNDRTRPTLSIVEMIKKKIPDINTDWLMFGTGDMFQHPAAASAAPPRPETRPSVAIPPSEPMIEFGPAPAPTPSVGGSQPPYYNGVRGTHQEVVREQIKFVDKPKRHGTEIRVYYDDQTWECFVPS